MHPRSQGHRKRERRPSGRSRYYSPQPEQALLKNNACRFIYRPRRSRIYIPHGAAPKPRGGRTPTLRGQPSRQATNALPPCDPKRITQPGAARITPRFRTTASKGGAGLPEATEPRQLSGTLTGA